MSSTVTITPIVIQPEYQSKLPVVLSLRGELDHAKCRFALWQDPRSKEIHEFVTRLLQQQPPTAAQLADPEWQRDSESALTALITDRLVDDVEGLTVDKPMLIRGWTVEKWLLDECGELFQFFPGDMGNVSDAKPHEYLETMLSLMRKCVAVFPTKPTLRLAPSTEEQKRDPDYRLLRMGLICSSIANTQDMRNAEKTQQEMEELSIVFQKAEAKLRAAKDADLEAQVAKRKAELEELKTSTQRIATKYRGSEEIMKGRIQGAETQIKDQETVIAGQGQQITNLEVHIGQLQAEINRRAQEYRNLQAQANHRPKSRPWYKFW